MNRSQYRNRWLRQHAQYEKIAYKELIQGFRYLGNSIPFTFMDKYNYKDLLSTSFGQDKFINIYYDIYKTIGVIHGNRIGRTINKQSKNFTSNGFLSLFESELISWLLNNTIQRITTVRDTYLKYIISIIEEGLSNGDSISEISTKIVELINKKGFYRWQALRIARTETTAASNYAAIQAGNSSGIVMEKVWISAVDNRTRQFPKDEFDHIRMDGVKVGINETFKVPYKNGIQEMQFAGDPTGSAGNVINCRCANALTPKRDNNGRIVRA